MINVFTNLYNNNVRIVIFRKNKVLKIFLRIWCENLIILLIINNNNIICINNNNNHNNFYNNYYFINIV